jgi:hypothetical protein
MANIYLADLILTKNPKENQPIRKPDPQPDILIGWYKKTVLVPSEE